MNRFLIAAALLFAALAFSLNAAADPGVGQLDDAPWSDSGTCRPGLMDATHDVCQYTFTDLTDSELFVLDNGPWYVSLEPSDATDVIGTALVQLRCVDGPTDTTLDSYVVNGVTLDGNAATNTRTIYFVPAGRCWIDVTGDPGAVNATVTIAKM